jgi:predicted aspartyl protease
MSSFFLSPYVALFAAPIFILLIAFEAGRLAIRLALSLFRSALLIALAALCGLALFAAHARAQTPATPGLHHAPLFVRNNVFYVHGSINGRFVMCLVDSGAAVNVMSMALLADLPSGTVERTVSIEGTTVGDGRIAPAMRIILSDISINTREASPVEQLHVSVFVMPTTSTDCILGTPFWTQFKSFAFVHQQGGGIDGDNVLLLRD